MSDTKVYPVPDYIREKAHITKDTYEEMHRRSLDDPEGFGANRLRNSSTGSASGTRSTTPT